MPEVDLFSKIVVDSIIVAIVGYSITLSMAKIFAHKFNYAVDGNQELFSEVFGRIFVLLVLKLDEKEVLSRKGQIWEFVSSQTIS